MSPDEVLPHARQLARGIQQDHIQRNGWRDSGQNFTTTRAGIVLEGRCGSLVAAEKGWVLQGAHAGVVSVNQDHWGIEDEGEYDVQHMPTVQWAALVALCAQLCVWATLDSATIKGHRDFKSTDCPGEWLYGQLDRLREEVHLAKLALLQT